MSYADDQMIIANYEYELQMAACGNTVACKYDMNV
jgi:hypothetical protein